MTRGRELTSFAVAGFIAYTDETDQAFYYTSTI